MYNPSQILRGLRLWLPLELQELQPQRTGCDLRDCSALSGSYRLQALSSLFSPHPTPSESPALVPWVARFLLGPQISLHYHSVRGPPLALPTNESPALLFSLTEHCHFPPLLLAHTTRFNHGMTCVLEVRLRHWVGNFVGARPRLLCSS